MNARRDRPPDVTAAARIGGDRKGLLKNVTGEATRTVYADRPFIVTITGTRRREWGRYQTLQEAEAVSAKLRTFGFDAHTVDAAP